MTKTHSFSWRQSQTKEQKVFYTKFKNIKLRCNNPKNKSYKDYWARWIKCLWDSFEQFRDDMWDSFRDHMNKHGLDNTTIDRIDNNGNYCKENCKWSTRKEQGYNKRNNKIAIIDGKEYCAEDLKIMLWIWEWAAQNRITQYLKWMMTKEKVFTKGRLYQDRKKYLVWDELYDVYRLMKECDIPLVTAENRLRKYQKGAISLEILLHKWRIRNRCFIS